VLFWGSNTTDHNISRALSSCKSALKKNENTWARCLLHWMGHTPRGKAGRELAKKIVDFYYSHGITILGFSQDELSIYDQAWNDIPFLAKQAKHGTLAVIKDDIDRAVPEEGLITLRAFKHNMPMKKIMENEIHNIKDQIIRTPRKNRRKHKKNTHTFSKMSDWKLAKLLSKNNKFIQATDETLNPPTYIDKQDFMNQMINAEIFRIKYETEITPEKRQSKIIVKFSEMADQEIADFLKYDESKWAFDFRELADYYYKQIEEQKDKLIYLTIREIAHMLYYAKQMPSLTGEGKTSILEQNEWYKISWNKMTKDKYSLSPKGSPFRCSSINDRTWKQVDLDIQNNQKLNIPDKLAQNYRFVSYLATSNQVRDFAESMAKCLTGRPERVTLDKNKSKFIEIMFGYTCK